MDSVSTKCGKSVMFDLAERLHSEVIEKYYRNLVILKKSVFLSSDESFRIGAG